MKRVLLTCIAALGMASAMSIAVASHNFFTAAELYCSPVPRPRHGKTGIARIKRAARKYKARRKHAQRR